MWVAEVSYQPAFLVYFQIYLQCPWTLDHAAVSPLAGCVLSQTHAQLSILNSVDVICLYTNMPWSLLPHGLI